jgi:hypothetical protein
MKLSTLPSLVLVALLATPACMVPVDDSIGEGDDSELGVTSDALWTIGPTVTTVEWDSGSTNNLSAWKSITCTSSYGDDYLLTDLRAYKEPLANLDNFIAKLRGTCSEYTDTNGNYEQNGSSSSETVFTANHRTPGTRVSVDDDRYPIGVFLVKDWGNNYIKNVSVLSVEDQGGVLGPYANPFATTLAFTNLNHVTGGDVTLQCGDQKVMTGLKLKHSTNTGKIRRIRIFCRSLTDV